MNNIIKLDEKNGHADSFSSSLFLILMKNSNITERIKIIRTCIWLLFSCPLHSTLMIFIAVHSMYLIYARGRASAFFFRMDVNRWI